MERLDRRSVPPPWGRKAHLAPNDLGGYSVVLVGWTAVILAHYEREADAQLHADHVNRVFGRA